MHVDDERLERLLDGELAPADEATTRAHLAGCDECTRRFRTIEREAERTAALLHELDRPAPEVDFGAIARRAAAHGPRIPRWAAGVALVLGVTGVAYALPGSPLPHWVGALSEWASGRLHPHGPVTTDIANPDRSVAGIAVPPGQALLILFRESNAGGEMLVDLTSGTEVEVRAPRGAATFTSGEDRLVVEDRGLRATYEIDIPITAPRVEIRVGDARVFLKEGPRVTTALPSGSAAPYRLQIAATPR